MSTTIDYQRAAFYRDITSENSTYVKREVLVLAEIGSSNCYDMNNRRARDWKVFAFGAAYRVYARVAEHASSAAGGMLVLNRMGGGGSDYAKDVIKVIRAYDRAIKSASPFEEAFKRYSIRAELRVTDTLDEYNTKRLAVFLEKYGLTVDEKKSYYGATLKFASLTVGTADTLSDIHQFKHGKSTDVAYAISQRGAY